VAKDEGKRALLRRRSQKASARIALAQHLLD
jgi:hypothetical protein